MILILRTETLVGSSALTVVRSASVIHPIVPLFDARCLNLVQSKSRLARLVLADDANETGDKETNQAMQLIDLHCLLHYVISDNACNNLCSSQLGGHLLA